LTNFYISSINGKVNEYSSIYLLTVLNRLMTSKLAHHEWSSGMSGDHLERSGAAHYWHCCWSVATLVDNVSEVDILNTTCKNSLLSSQTHTCRWKIKFGDYRLQNVVLVLSGSVETQLE